VKGGEELQKQLRGHAYAKRARYPVSLKKKGKREKGEKKRCQRRRSYSVAHNHSLKLAMGARKKGKRDLLKKDCWHKEEGKKKRDRKNKLHGLSSWEGAEKADIGLGKEMTVFIRNENSSGGGKEGGKPLIKSQVKKH